MTSATLVCVVLALAASITIVTASFAPASPTAEQASVIIQNGVYTVVNGYVDGAVATASFDDTLESTGWGIFYVTSSAAYNDSAQMYAAGLIEGALTARHIYNMSVNMNAYFFGDKSPQKQIIDFFATQNAYVSAQIAALPNDPLWIGVNLIQQQLIGLIDGYAQSAVGQAFPLQVLDFQLLNGVGDLLDLIPALVKEKRVDWAHLSKEKAIKLINARSLCSGLIRVNGDLTTLLASHSSWFTYSATNRIFKHYYFDLASQYVSAKGMSFSSYPGFLESLDDFYLMSNNLTMIQTTNSIFNNSLYDLVAPNSLFAWQRVRLANLFASTGAEWYEWAKRNNSGTYNNQYMVINYNLFTPGQPLLPGTLFVSEQIPGLFVGGDVTRELERGYFASYNVPYWIEIYNASGYPAVVKSYGFEQSYQLAPRAKIFRRDVGTVTDINSLEHIMRSNNYKSDPYADGSPWNAICSRGDLAGSDGGCYDTKVTDNTLAVQGRAYALNGPTTAGGTLAPFAWTGQWTQQPHAGLPQVYNFSFIPTNAMWPQNTKTSAQTAAL